MNRLQFLQTILSGSVIPTHLGATLNDQGARMNSDNSPKDDPDWLVEWNRRPILPVVESDDPMLQRIANSVRTDSRIEFNYFGGTEPGGHRTATPLLLFVRVRPNEIEEWLLHHYEYRVFKGKPYIDIAPSKPGDCGPVDFKALTKWALRRNPAHLLAWCHTREAKRCFRVDRMVSPQEKSIFLN